MTAKGNCSSIFKRAGNHWQWFETDNPDELKAFFTGDRGGSRGEEESW
jgi:hypothetical protein